MNSSQSGWAKIKKNAEIKRVMDKHNNVEYLIVSLKFFQFRAPQAIPETVMLAIPIETPGKNAITIILHAIVNDAISSTPEVVIIR